MRHDSTILSVSRWALRSEFSVEDPTAVTTFTTARDLAVLKTNHSDVRCKEAHQGASPGEGACMCGCELGDDWHGEARSQLSSRQTSTTPGRQNDGLEVWASNNRYSTLVTNCIVSVKGPHRARKTCTGTQPSSMQP